MRGSLAVHVGTASGGPGKGLRVPHEASALAAVATWCDGLGAAALTPWGAADQSTGPGCRLHRSWLCSYAQCGGVWATPVHVGRAGRPGPEGHVWPAQATLSPSREGRH